MAEKERKCPKCKRLVLVSKDGSLGVHGPGPAVAGTHPFVCSGSGDKSMVKAAKNLKV